ncbi:MAG: hypothetical protein QNJ45_05935 [Ardenticatenaceae bacterium]|nr:hypothetical protein [Ardenticatenaceae bacterium]
MVDYLKQTLGVLLIILAGLFFFISTSEANHVQEATPINIVGSSAQCRLSSVYLLSPAFEFNDSSTSSQTTAICEKTQFYSPISQSIISSETPENPSVCGGEPGQTVSSTIILDGDLVNLSALGATFDQDGCADLSDVIDQADQPLAPTALKLVNASATNRLGWQSSTGLIGLFCFFVIVTGGWLFMLKGEPVQKKK